VRHTGVRRRGRGGASALAGPSPEIALTPAAAYGVGFEDFARQMTLIDHAGYQTIDLETFVRFVQGQAVELPRGRSS